MLNEINEFCRHNKDLAGIVDGERAFRGPELLQLDPTNACNNDCIACWCRSPLLKERRIAADVENLSLPIDVIRKLLDDCAALGTTNVYLAGGGEPFMHPHILDIVAHIKQLGMACHINTNFTLVTHEMAEQLVAVGVDHFIISLWAATPETYVACHPNKTEKAFEDILDVIRHLLKVRKGGLPNVKLYNVIMNLNYFEIEAMVDLAYDLGVNCAEFAVADVIPGSTDQLLLNNEQRAEILQFCKTSDEKVRPEDAATEIYLDEFKRRVGEVGAADGEYDQLMLTDIPCVIGWNFARVLPNGNVNACLKAHRIPVGNLHETSFAEIWNGSKQKEFRKKTRIGDPNDPYFFKIGNDINSKKIGCHRGCDDIERNRRLWGRYQQLSLIERLYLRSAGYCYRIEESFQKNKKR